MIQEEAARLSLQGCAQQQDQSGCFVLCIHWIWCSLRRKTLSNSHHLLELMPLILLHFAAHGKASGV